MFVLIIKGGKENLDLKGIQKDIIQGYRMNNEMGQRQQTTR